MRKIAEIKITSITPLGQGGFNPNKCDKLGPRGSSIRGSLRWWLRALVGGVLYDKGLSNKEIKELTLKFIGKLLGMTNESSKFIFRTQSKVKRYSLDEIRRLYDRNSRRVEHIRLQLLSFGKHDVESYLRNLLCQSETTISIYSAFVLSDPKKLIKIDINESSIEVKIIELEKLVLQAMIIALLLGGLGKGSRRGLGAFIIREVNILDKLHKKAYSSGSEKILSNIKTESEIENLLEETYSLINNIFGTLKSNNRTLRDSLPPFPTLSKKASKIYIKRIQEKVDNPIERLKILNRQFLKNFFLRINARPMTEGWEQSLIRELHELKPIKKQKDKRRFYYVTIPQKLGSYILGLPRQASTDSSHNMVYKFDPFTGKGTYQHIGFDDKLDPRKGYRSGFAKPKINKNIIEGWEQYRRASPLIVTYVSDEKVALVFMKSADWPPELWWFSKFSKEQYSNITPRTIQEAYKVVEDYLDRHYKEFLIWPNKNNKIKSNFPSTTSNFSEASYNSRKRPNKNN